MNTDRLYEILQEVSYQTRKGEIIEEEVRKGINVTHVYVMPHESEIPDMVERIDCHFVIVAVDKSKAELRKVELVEILNSYPQPERLAGGPSYIELGGVLGDQGAALQLMAVGKVLGLWDIITPEVLGIIGAEADQMAGAGLVMMSGFSSVESSVL